MQNKSTLRAVQASVFAALVCAATVAIRIPSPTGGYLNLGDGVALLGAYLLGPGSGAAAAGLGSMLADLLAGYPMYAPGTLAVKALSALVAGAAFRALRRRRGGRPLPRILLSAACGEAVMALGYLAYAALALGYGAGALAELPGNLAQGVAGIAVASALTPPLLLRRRG